MNIKYFVITATLAVVIVSAIIFQHYRSNRNSAPRNAVIGSNQAVFVGSEKQVTSFSEDIQKLNNFWDHIHRARQLSDSNDYQNAMNEYQLAISKSRSEGDVWMARSSLAELYEKMGRHKLALDEVAWLESHTSRADVLANLAETKERLLKKINESLPDEH